MAPHKIISSLKRVLCVASLLLPAIAGAEDIDLFEGGAAITGHKPNVLIILDNTSNWARASEWNATDTEATQGAAQIEAIKTALSVLTSDVRVGLMMQSQSGNTTGGYVRFGLRDMNTSYRTALTSILGGIKGNVNDPSEKVSQSSYSGALREAYQYFSNLSIYGPNDGKRDYAGNASYNVSPFTAGNVSGNPLDSAADTTYTGPLSVNDPCGKNYIIFIGNEWNQTTDTTHGLETLGGNVSPIYSILNGDNHYGDEWTRFLKQQGAIAPCQGDVCANGKVVTYTINVCYKSCITQPQLGTQQEALLKSMAAVGGGRYFRATSTQEIKTALATIFNEVQAVNSVFTSASLPVSVNTQGTYLNQIYMGVFRPEGAGAPRWLGNLKQYKFGLTTDAIGQEVLFLSDKNGNPAVNLETGFISPNAESYWTTAMSPACSTDPTKGFWCFSPSGVGEDKDLPDGDLVEKGGAAQKLRALGPAGRTVYTCTPNCTSNETPASWATTNASLLSALGGATSNVSLSRAGTVVTGTTATALGLNSPTDSVTISGAPSAYNGVHGVTKLSDTQFSFTIPETPATPATGSLITVSSGNPVQQALASLTFDNGTGLATATLVNHGFIAGQNITIGGVTGSATDTVLNGTFPITVTGTDTFTYAPTLGTSTTESPAAIAPPGVAGGTVTCGSGGPYAISGIARNAGSDIVTIRSSVNTTACKMNPSPATITVSGAPAGYDTSTTLYGVDGACPHYAALGSVNNRTICYTITTTSSTVTVPPTSPAVGAPITATGTPTRPVASIERTAGNASNIATVTLTTTGTHGFEGASSITVAGADQAEYNGTKMLAANSLSFPSTTTMTFTLTTGPATPAAGVAGKGFDVDPSTLVNWVRGMDNKDDENLNSSLTDVRASIHGDVLHSRPLIINYGAKTSDADPSHGIYAFYGANDGMLRAVKVGQEETSGVEAWSFVAPEHYAKLGRLYLNTPLVKYPGTSDMISPAPTKRDYFFDGNLGAYQSADLNTTHIFVSMRRGGRGIYAFDVSTPTAPKFLWKRFNTDTDFSELGQTWSEPKVVPIRKTAGSTCNPNDPSTYTRALIFGAGYDAAQEDLTATTVRSPTMGRGIFVLNAANGNLIKMIALPNDSVGGIANSTKRYSVPSDVSVLDMNGDGCYDRLYVGDTGANLFRVDIGNANPDKWRAYKLAALGDVGNNGGSDNRKFLYPPDVVAGFINDQQVTYILAGTGDREQPRSTAIQDKFFMIKDTLSGDTSLLADDNTVSITPLTIGDLTEVTNFSNPGFDATASTFKGWYISYKDGDNLNTGEKTVNAPRTVGGITFFGTNRPMTAEEISANAACTPDLGVARGYAVNFLSGTAAFDRNGDGQLTREDLYADFVGGGLPPSAVSGVVELDDGKVVRFMIGSGGSSLESSAIEGAKTLAAPSSRRTRVFWYFRKDD